MERRDAWKKSKIKIRYIDQAKSLTEIRRGCREWSSMIRRSQQLTLWKLEKAFIDFFLRCHRGLKPGFPRHKSFQRFSGWTLGANEGYKFSKHLDDEGKLKCGKLTLSGVGAINFRGSSRETVSKIKYLDVVARRGRWIASIVCEVPGERKISPDRCVGIDWGVDTLAVVADSEGRVGRIANTRIGRTSHPQLRKACREFSRSLRGRRSKSTTKKRLRVARLYEKMANKRLDRSHKLSAFLAENYKYLAIEKLNIESMTKSRAGTIARPGKHVSKYRRLSREIKDTAPGMLTKHLIYKAAEAGGSIVCADTRRYTPSQLCPSCGKSKKKTLSQRRHICPCGANMCRDEAAAKVLLLVANELKGRVSAGARARSCRKASTQNV